MAAMLLCGAAACGGAQGELASPAEAASSAAPVTRDAPRGAPTIEVIEEIDHTPPGGDGAPHQQLAFAYADGTRVPIAERAIAWTAFRDGVALVSVDRRLLLVTPDGAERALALRSGAPPTTAPDGALLYVSQQDLVAELHRLEPDGRDRILASGLSSAGVLSPQDDGRVLFVGASNGGIAGVWIADPAGDARCLSNCALRTGGGLGDGHLPLPAGPEAMRIERGRVEWRAADGTRHSRALLDGGAELPSVTGAGDDALAAPGRTETP